MIKPTHYFLTAFVLAIFILSILFGPFYALALIDGSILLAILLRRPKLLLPAYWLIVGVQKYIKFQVSDSLFIKLVDEVFILVFVFVLVSIYIINKERYRREILIFNKFVFFLISLIIFSGVINTVRPFTAIQFMITYFGFIPVFYVALYTIQPKDLKFLFFFLLIFLIIQLSCNLGWFFEINPLPNMYLGSVDFSIGLISDSVVIAYLSILVFFLTFSYFRIIEPEFRSRFLIIIFPLTFLQTYLTHANHAFILFGFLLIFYIILIDKSLKHLFFIGTAVTVSFVILQLVDLSTLSSDSTLKILSYENLRDRWFMMAIGPKGEAFRNMFLLAPKEMPFFPIGAGPGNFGSSIGVQEHSFWSLKYINYILLAKTGRLSMEGGSITQHVITGYTAIWSELGPIGLFLFLGLHLYAGGRIWKQLRNRLYTYPYQKIMAEGFIIAMSLYLIVNLLTDLLHSDIVQGGIWILAAAVWMPYNDMKPVSQENEK